MSSTTRMTLKSTNERIDALEGTIEAGFQQVFALLTPAAPAKAVARKPAKKAAAKAPAKKAPAKKAAPKATLRPLSKKSRVAFVAAARKEGVDFSGLSTKAIAEHCVAEGYAPKGFTIGEGYRALFS